MADMLAHLAELDERRLFLDLGYSSLFAYCTEALGFCKSTAGRRIAAARVCRRYSEVFLRVAKGELRLSVLSVLGAHLNADNASELFEACSGKSFEQVEELLAARFPRPDVRDLIRRLPSAARVSPDVGSEDPRVVLKYATREQGFASTGQCQAANAAIPANIPRQTADPGLSQERVEPLSPDRFGVHFTADAAFRELLEEVKALASHQQPRGELLPIMTRALEAYRRELQKKRFAVGVKMRGADTRAADTRAADTRAADTRAADTRAADTRAADTRGADTRSADTRAADPRAADTRGADMRGADMRGADPRGADTRSAVDSDSGATSISAAPLNAKRTRRISAAVRRTVYERDEGGCTFVSNDGRRCGARQFLEMDHVQPWAMHGESTVDNLRLRCRAHNQHSARSQFGSVYVRAAVERVRCKQPENTANSTVPKAGCGEPVRDAQC